MTAMFTIACLLVGYLFGSVPTGYLYAKAHGVDIFHKGSGNPGTTNALRTMGKKAGASVLLLDLAKTMVPIFIMRAVFPGEVSEDIRLLITLTTGFGVIMGHNFPFTMKFHGGKGIACTGGMLLLADIRLTLVLLVVFICVIAVSRYVSLGSLVGVSLNFIGTVLLAMTGYWEKAWSLSSQEMVWIILISFLVMVSAFFMHRANIVRLMHGEENPIYGKKKGEKA